ncbi:NAD synthetase / Glutamine amidotransferase chain of NAD synthetase [hydrothermal vent metagenome]|uniref:NAD(+) synthase (glutamine-hydrolyzing) n=1 Tax=hydrothermal vent metagenome TaxID=652676 RepID=A0A3B1DFM8_9ZZZZ
MAQLNPVVGDIEGNTLQVRVAAEQAAAMNADLLVTSELVISGYPPKDLLLREHFVAACDHAIEELARESPVAILVGHPTLRTATGKQLPTGCIANGASLLHDGIVQQTIHKTLLPNYDVFDEQRYFLAGDEVQLIDFAGQKLGVHICEDAWWGQPETSYHVDSCQRRNPIAQLTQAGADILINLSASPFETGKKDRRINIFRQHLQNYPLPFLFVNQVGGNDDLVFDGHSMALTSSGEIALQLPGFQTDVIMCNTATLQADKNKMAATNNPHQRESDLLDALILGLRDYMKKCGFNDCVLGLSGGIDSALACYIAAKAVGPEHVHGLLMPSRYSSQHSIDDAQKLAENLGVPYDVVSIEEIHKAYEQTAVVGDDLRETPAGLADQNLQARIRGAMIMVRSNRQGWMALATGNKSELAIGYCTLYGDMAGGFAVLCDVFKRDVYKLSLYANEVREKKEVIPNSTIEKVPSAELAPNQMDQDSLPPYPVLDAILEGLIEQEASVSSLSELYPQETVEWVATKLDRNEFKRRQMPPGIKLSQRAFGSGRRMPMAAKIDHR